MNKFPLLHPKSEDLLLYIDGELPPSAYAAIRKHIEGCWKCRSEMEDLESAISEFMRYKTKVDELRPAGARSSDELRRKMNRLEAELGQPGLWSRVRKLLALPGPAYAQRLAVGILVIATGWAAVTVLQHFVPAFKTPAPVRQIAPAIRPEAPGQAVIPTAPPASLPQPKTAIAPPHLLLRAGAPEIAALVKLHELGADLGEPVETVAAANGAVTVICRQVGRQRETEIRSALANIPGVTVRTEPAAREDRGKPSTPLSLGSGANPLARALTDPLGGKAVFDSLANEILEQDDGLMARAYALHAIEERFPASRLAELEPPDRAALAAVIADHRRAAFQKGSAIESLLAPISKALRLATPARRPPAAAEIFPAAQHMDRILNVIFGDSPSDRTAAELGAELHAARGELAAALEAIR